MGEVANFEFETSHETADTCELAEMTSSELLPSTLVLVTKSCDVSISSYYFEIIAEILRALVLHKGNHNSRVEEFWLTGTAVSK